MSNIDNALITNGIGMEHAAIFIRRFRDPEGKPTCCANAETGDACKFLGVRNFGAVSSCMLGEQLDLSRQQNGFLRPHDKCDVWADAVFNGRGASSGRERMANQIRARMAEQAARLYAEMDTAVAEVRERCAALRKDAERYRWLRAGRVLRQGHPTTLIEREVMTIDRLQARLAFRAWCSENELDASIDAAMPANTVFGAA